MRISNSSLSKIQIQKLALIYFGVITTGVILPYFVHVFGGILAGRMLLPLHFVILISGFLFGWEMGLLTGLTLPIVSFFLTGMPPLPILPLMIIEIGLYGFSSGFFYKHLHKNIFFSLILSLITGRIFLFLFYFIFKGSFSPFWLQLKTGILGILIQIVFIPLIIFLFNPEELHRMFFYKKNK